MLPNDAKLIIEHIGFSASEVEKYLRKLSTDPYSLSFVGSLAMGFGNARSDIDFLLIYPPDSYIIGDSRKELSEDKNKTHYDPFAALGSRYTVFHRGIQIYEELSCGARVNVEVVSYDDIAYLQQLVSAYVARAAYYSQEAAWREKSTPPKARHRPLELTDHHILFRAYHGMPICSDDRITKELSGWNYSDFVNYSVLKCGKAILGYVEDLKGIYLENKQPDVLTVRFICDTIFYLLAHLILSSIGEVSASEKFLPRLLKRNQEAIGNTILDLYYNTYWEYRRTPENIPYPTNVMMLIDQCFDYAARKNNLFQRDMQARNQSEISALGQKRVIGW